MTKEEREYQEYLRWRAGILAQIEALLSEIAEYKSFESSVSGLKSLLASYAGLLQNVHYYTVNGISSSELMLPIDGIKSHANEATSASGELDSVLGEITSKIGELEEKVAALRAMLG